MDSHNGTANIEVWVHRSDHGNTAAGDNKGMKERARLAFRTHNGTIKALVVRAPIPKIIFIANWWQ